MFNYYNNIFDQINQMCKIYQQFTNEYCQPKCGFPYKNKISKIYFVVTIAIIIVQCILGIVLRPFYCRKYRLKNTI